MFVFGFAFRLGVVCVSFCAKWWIQTCNLHFRWLRISDAVRLDAEAVVGASSARAMCATLADAGVHTVFAEADVGRTSFWRRPVRPAVDVVGESPACLLVLDASEWGA